MNPSPGPEPMPIAFLQRDREGGGECPRESGDKGRKAATHWATEGLSPVSNSATCRFMNPASHLTFIQTHLLFHEMETM